MSLLRIEQLQLSIAADQRARHNLLDGVDLQVERGEIVGLVGESGCGKSLTALSILQLLPRPQGRIEGGRILFEGRDVTQLPERELHALRGGRVSMIFQDAMSALNPVQRIGRQLLEVLALHRPEWPLEKRRQHCVRLLAQVGLPDPAERLRAYPHQLSGGQRQRVMIAMALACEPALLIADEPTTALDVTIQAQVLTLIRELQQQSGTAVLFITHDLGVVAQLCQRVAVMYAGRIVETAPAEILFRTPRHPYTRALLSALPRLDAPTQVELATIPGQVPAPGDFPAGCRFANRCAYARDICRNGQPILESTMETAAAQTTALETRASGAVISGQAVACLRWRELDND